MPGARRRAFPWWRFAAALALSVGLAAAYARLWHTPLIGAIEGQTLNWRFQLRGPVAPPPEVAIAAIDDATLAAVRRWPLPRRALGEAIARLDRAGAAVIGLDLLLVDREQPTDGIGLAPGDRALRASLRAAGDRAVLGMAFTFGATAGVATEEETGRAVRRAAFRIVRDRAAPRELRTTGALLPIAPLRETAGLGHVNVVADEDGVLRHLQLALRFGDDYLPAFPVELVRRYLGLSRSEVALLLGRGLRLGDRMIPADPLLRLTVNHYGPAGTIPTFSLVDLLEGRVAATSLEGRVLLIGATALGAGDSFATPYGRALPGVEVLAAAAGNLLTGRAVVRSAATIGWSLAAVLLLGMASFAVAHLPSPVLAGAGTLALLGAWAATAQAAFETRLLWLDLTFPSAAILANAALVAVARIVAERRGRQEMERQRGNLSRYHSPLIADLLATEETPSFDRREQTAAILFVDIAGFTGRSERIGPAETVRFLTAFHARVERAVLAHGGVLEQFLGDGAMVIFGMPRPSPTDAASALACARDLVASVKAWAEDLAKAGAAEPAEAAPPVRIGVGVHCGPVVIARLGGERQVNLTAAGDTVNLASRLQTLTRQHDAAIAISAAVVEAVRAVGRDDLLEGFAALPPQPIRGREAPVAVWIARGEEAGG